MYKTQIRIVITVLMIWLLLLGFTFIFAAEPLITISPKWPKLKLDVKECGGFSEDSLILKIKNNSEEITHEFCSSYGKADAQIVKDAIGDKFLILKFGEGRGTNSVSEYISVYRIQDKFMKYEYVRIPISEGAGPVSRWYYEYEITKPNEGGLVITLRLRIEGTGAIVYPHEKKRVIKIK
jgi:hypothetical protein